MTEALDWDHCTTMTKNRVIVRQERRSSIRLRNPDQYQVSCIQVDGCLLAKDRDRRRCDWLFEVDQEDCKRAWYVELKGKNVLHALEQLLDTLTHPALLKRHRGFVRHCVVVATRVPRMDSSRQVLQERIRKKGAKLHKIRNPFEADLCAP